MVTNIVILCSLLSITVYTQNCEADQFFNGQRCAPCKSNCRCEVQGQCDSCISGYTFDQTFSSCVQCPGATDSINVGCRECCYQIQGTSFICSSCPSLSDTHLIGGQCLRLIGCSSVDTTGRCKSCRSGYYLQNGICTACDSRCSKCVDSTLCLSCSTGYFANNAIDYGYCQSCQSNCISCTSSTDCTSCASSFRLDTGNCIACPSFCSQCDAGGCSSCISGSTLIGSLCYACTDLSQGGSIGCTTCSTSSGSSVYCTKCIDGYYLSSGSCANCHFKFANSALCTSSQVLQCKDDYDSVLINRYHKMGNSCVSNSRSCKSMSSSSGKCQSCYFGSGYYYRKSGDSCIQCQQTGCQSYSSSTCECKGCLNQYQYVNTQCIACQNPHCYKCQSSVTQCETCAPYYGLISSACIGCTQLQCLNCDGDISLCNECLQGYYISQGLCYQCQDSCKACVSSTKCSQCKSGHYLHQNGRCKRLPSNCAKVNQQANCIKCQYGYQLKYGYCFPCSPAMFNLQQCEKFCPSYYAKLQIQVLFRHQIIVLLALFSLINLL